MPRPLAAERLARGGGVATLGGMTKARPLVILLAMLALWLPLICGVVAPGAAERREMPRKIAEHELRQIEGLPFERREMAAMRATNPEWELLGRGMLALSLVDMALADRSLEARHLAAVDRLIEEALEGERREGVFRFLLPYARGGPLPRSLFVDGQLAMMLGARLSVAPRGDFRAELERRARRIEEAMEGLPSSFAVSYPDEGWTYDHTTALAALRVWDALSGEDHKKLSARWVEAARARLVDPATGLLVSSFRASGAWKDRAEGSSVWVSAHNLLLVDPAFAREQYARGKALLERDVLGFVVAREWPEGQGHPDIDSGPVVPLLGASPGSSGLLLVGAAAFGDDSVLDGLVASLRLAAFPVERGNTLVFRAAGQVGNGAILRALSFGPLWKKVSFEG